MKRLSALLFLCAVNAVIFTGCGAPAGNNTSANTANKPANTANAANTATAPAGDTAAAEAEVKKLMDTAQTALAKNDADAMEKIYADNYMLVNLDGSVQTKAERLAALRSGDAKYTAFSYSEPNIRVNPEGTGAVVIAKLAMKGMMKGKAMDGDYRVTQVYSKTKDGWKQVSAQATKIEGVSAPAKTESNKPTDKKPDAAPANK